LKSNDCGKRYIEKSQHYSSQNGGYYQEETKTEISYRRVGITTIEVDVLKKIKEERNARDEDYVCINSLGQPFNNDTLSSNFRRAARSKKRGNKKISFKSLRSSTIMIEHYEVSEEVVLEMVGHDDIMTTRKNYTS